MFLLIFKKYLYVPLFFNTPQGTSNLISTRVPLKLFSENSLTKFSLCSRKKKDSLHPQKLCKFLFIRYKNSSHEFLKAV